jgi:hypothetical protein
MMIRHLADHLLTSEDNLKFSREKLMSINVLGLAELAVYLPTNVADKLSSSGDFGRAKKSFLLAKYYSFHRGNFLLILREF